MTEYKAREQMPESVVAMIAVVGELLEIKKKFDAGTINVEQLADDLWDKVQALVPVHSRVIEEAQQ